MMIVLVTIVVAITLVVLITKATALEAVAANNIVQLLRRNVVHRRYWLAGLAAVAVLSAAVLLYWNLGHHDQSGTKPVAAPVAGGAMDLPQLTKKLAARLEHNPDDGEGWLLLAKSYTQFERYAEAKQALSQALKRLPQNADVLADWVDTRVMAEREAWSTEARDTLAAALAANPAHPKALWLAGTEALDRVAYQEAVSHWEKLSTLAGPESEYGRKARTALVEVRALVAGKKSP